MSDDPARAAARAAIDRHLAGRRRDGAATSAGVAVAPGPAFTLCVVPAGGEGDGACLIEPSVPCNHCGFCKSFGH
jgi:hypothetical protein